MESAIGTPHFIDHVDARRHEARRLIALALETLADDREQIVRDYLNHALGALERLSDSPTGDR